MKSKSESLVASESKAGVWKDAGAGEHRQKQLKKGEDRPRGAVDLANRFLEEPLFSRDEQSSLVGPRSSVPSLADAIANPIQRRLPVETEVETRDELSAIIESLDGSRPHVYRSSA